MYVHRAIETLLQVSITTFCPVLDKTHLGADHLFELRPDFESFGKCHFGAYKSRGVLAKSHVGAELIYVLCKVFWEKANLVLMFSTKMAYVLLRS